MYASALVCVCVCLCVHLYVRAFVYVCMPVYLINITHCVDGSKRHFVIYINIVHIITFQLLYGVLCMPVSNELLSLCW